MTNKEKKIVYIELEQSDSNSNIIELFNSLFEVEGIVEDNNIIYILENEKMYEDYELKSMIDTIKEDFGVSINVFESNIIKENTNVKDYISIYKSINKQGYINTASLVLNLIDKDNTNLSKVKDYVFYSFEKDTDLLFVCKAMFKNNLNVSKASDDAYMHRNTVINKLDQIYKKTGLNIQKFNDAMAMYILINTK